MEHREYFEQMGIARFLSMELDYVTYDDVSHSGAGPLSKFIKAGKGEGSQVLSESFVP